MRKNTRGIIKEIIISDTKKLICIRCMMCILTFLIAIFLSCKFKKENSELPWITDVNLEVLFVVFMILAVLMLVRKALFYFYNGIDEIYVHLKSVDKNSRHKIKKCIELVTDPKIIICIFFIGGLFSVSMFKEWNNSIEKILRLQQFEFEKLLYPYSFILTVIVVSCAFYGYICLGTIIWITKIVRRAKFINYRQGIPVSTPIIQCIFKMLNKGLALFWAVGIFLLNLAVLAKCFGAETDGKAHFIGNYQSFLDKQDAVSVIIVLLFTVGYIAFTYFPYYYLHKTIDKLKNQDIYKVYKKAKKKNMLESTEYISAVSTIYSSPTISLSNFWNILFSTLLAFLQLIFFFVGRG